MENKDKKIDLPKDLQIRMLQFFMKTSIPRKMKREQEEQKKSSIKKD